MSQRDPGQPFYLKKVEVNLAGFSIVELVVVLGGLSILTGLAVPNVLKWNKLAQIDEAKSLLNSAAVECLQRVRTHPNDYKTWQPESLKAKSLKSVAMTYSRIIDDINIDSQPVIMFPC